MNDSVNLGPSALTPETESPSHRQAFGIALMPPGGSVGVAPIAAEPARPVTTRAMRMASRQSWREQHE